MQRNILARHKAEDLCATKTAIKEEPVRVRIGEDI